MKSHKKFYKSSTRAIIIQYLGYFAILFAVFSVWNAIFKIFTFHNIIVGVWTIYPPVWFYIEYMFIFDNWDNDKAVEDFKYIQGLSSKMWAGLLALLALIYINPIKL